tara:strand:- start:462 stop:998 length:537 start_codon:yes stop_codon:yes gene_type:complete
MSWQMAVVGALGVAQFQQQGAIGKYNQAVQNRKSEVLKQEAKAIEQQKEFDLYQFNKQFQKLEGSQTVAAAKAGVTVGTGTDYNIKLSNALEAELQKNIIEYNANIGIARKMEESNFAVISGQIKRQEAKLAQLKTLTDTGTSLLTMSSGSLGTTSSYGSTGSNRMIIGSTGTMGGGV